MSSKNVQDKFKATMQSKYGCDYPQQNLCIKKKTEEKFIKKYGVSSVLSSEEIREDYRRNLKFVNGVMVSNLQIAIANLLNGTINVKIDNFYIDILIDKNIVVEYNGGGHKLKVFFGRMTEEEFDLKEKSRIELLNNLGYKVIVINNAKNKKPVFKELLEKIDFLRQSDIFYTEYNVS
jgi:very-short-patch-repair endonuclease